MTDTSMTALTKSINNIAGAFEEFKKVNDERLEAVKKGNESVAAELDVKLGRIEGDVKKFSTTQVYTRVEPQRLRSEYARSHPRA